MNIRIALVLSLVLSLSVVTPVWSDYPGCQPYPEGNSSFSPTHIKGCVVYGIGTASRYDGSGVARNDCLYPWKKCQTISIRSLDTGITIVVTPKMYCDCWLGLAPGTTGPNGEKPRIVDLNRAAVKALGLKWSSGVYRVEVQPSSGTPALPNTSMSGA